MSIGMITGVYWSIVPQGAVQLHVTFHDDTREFTVSPGLTLALHVCCHACQPQQQLDL